MGKSIIELSSVTRIGLDLAKNVFQFHAVYAQGEAVIRRRPAATLRRQFRLGADNDHAAILVRRRSRCAIRGVPKRRGD